MKSVRILLPVLLGVILGYIFEEQIKTFKYLNESYIVLFGLILMGFIFRKIKLIKKRFLIRTKYDFIYQIFNLIVGPIIIIFVLLKWIPDSFFHYFGLFFGLLVFFSGLLYENSIQLQITDNSLLINYNVKKQRDVTTINKIEIDYSIVRIFSDNTVIEINDVRGKDKDYDRIYNYLKSALKNIEIIKLTDTNSM